MSLKRKTPLKRGSSSLKRSRLNLVSKKRAKENREYSVRRKVFLEAHPLCEVSLNEAGVNELFAIEQWSRIGRPAYGLWYYNILIPLSTQIHHKNKRYGKRLNDESEWMAVSAEAHKKIEDNKKWARERGYLKNI